MIVSSAAEMMAQAVRTTADQLRRSGVLLLLPWGRGSGRMAGRLAQSLQKLEVPVLGAVICGANDSFLRAYYGAYYGKKGERT